MRSWAKCWKVFIMICFFIQAIGSATTPTYFHNGSFEEIKQKAGQEGKLFFVDFYADWCTPCKWMDQTVFTDKEVEVALTQNYIPIKVNIDDLAGFEMKQKYKVGVLPTILIFNSNGKVVERIEETLNVNELLEILSFHNNATNKLVIQHDLNTSPSKTNFEYNRSELEATYLRYIESENNRERNYRLQLGTYYDYESAFKKVNTLKKTFLEPIIVVNDYDSGKVRFKVMMGEFDTMAEAKSFGTILAKEFSMDSIIN